MNSPSQFNIEDKLAQARATSLSPSERATMLSELQAYAALHTPRAASGVVSSRWWWGGLAVTAASFVFMIGVGGASTQSLPDEPLYAMKVSVVEPLIGLTYISPNDRLGYQVTLLDRRIAELYELKAEGRVTEEALAVFEQELEGVTREVVAVVTDDISNELSATSTIAVVAKVGAIAKAQKNRSATEVSEENPWITHESDLQHLLEREVSDLIAEAPVTAPEYVGEVLSDIGQEVAEGDMATTTVSSIEVLLTEANDELATGDFEQAIESVHEAKQLIETEEHLDLIVVDVTVEQE